MAVPVRAPRPMGLRIPAPEPPWCGHPKPGGGSPSHIQSKNSRQHPFLLPALLKANIFFLTLCRDLRCSSSVPLKLMAWINAEHAHTWRRAGAHLGAGDSCRRGCSLSITKIRGSWASQLLSKQQLHKLKLPRARWSKLARPVRPGVQVL